MRVLLILADGMRPDALTHIEKAQNIIKKSAYTMEAKTVMPSVTLPCHMSLFHSVDPSRHGTTTNIYTPQVRPINGLCEVLNANSKTCAFFYNWEELRDLSRPGTLTYSLFCKMGDQSSTANDIITSAAIDYMNNNYTDFTFLYLGHSDKIGHKYGWMSDEYIAAVQNSWDNIERCVNSVPDDYTIIITADHGGHERIHGTELPEDMLIPLIINGKSFKAGKILNNADIKDIAPTIAKLLDIAPNDEWEGSSLI